MEDKRSRGLCFYCDEKYVAGHVCSKRRQLFSIEVDEPEGVGDGGEEGDVMLDSSEFLCMEGVEFEVDNEGAILPHVSVHAMTGAQDFRSMFRTMRVTGSVKGKAIKILIDTGSTHNFMDLNTAKRLGCHLTRIHLFVVSVADGNRMYNNFNCKGFLWKMQGAQFMSDMLTLLLGGCNMVLEVQWLITLGDILYNFRKLKMQFTYKVHKVSLRGIQPPAMKLVEQGKMDKLLANPAELSMMTVGLFATNLEPGASFWKLQAQIEIVKDKSGLQEVLQKYSDLFDVPKGLPPPRQHDHKIVLKEGTSLINTYYTEGRY